MTILSGNKIYTEILNGRIQIDPFKHENINPVSYDVTLGETVKIISNDCISGYLDPKVKNEFRKISICDYIVIVPGELYLMHTQERVYTEHYVPIMDGKSSIARMGVSIHQTAGFGDPGFNGQYTLEVTCIVPVKLYKGMKIGQFRFHNIDGEVTSYQKLGNYTGVQMGAVSSKAHKQFDSFQMLANFPPELED